MSFYGNITSTTKTGFSFDRIYPNKTEMMVCRNTDGVYLGRFVLVDYDQTGENPKKAYYPDGEPLTELTILYADTTCNIPIQFNSTGMVISNGLVTGVNKKDLVMLQDKNQEILGYYICVGADEEEPSLASFKRFSNTDEIYKWNYAANYEIDQQNNPNGSIGRGWDSTVWQKVYNNGKEDYVMVAELNSVVPTFTISADAPTLAPVAPHFDEVSNNTYYELHWQPQWGMRVRHAGTDEDVYLSGEVNKYPSDETMTWIQSVYNKEKDANYYYYYGTDGTWHFLDSYGEDQKEPNFEKIIEAVQQKDNGLLPAAIYYNKAGFNPAKHYSSNVEDRLQINPTGYSEKPLTYDENGQVATWELSKYNDHTRGYMSPQVDTQELSMILPSLGNTINDIWDIVYGIGVDENGNQVYLKDADGNIILNEVGRPQAEQNKSYDRLTFIDWTDPENDLDKIDTPRLRLVNNKDDNGFTFSADEVETLAGCINSVHDLMGMIIVNKENGEPNDGDIILTSSDDKIYYFNEDGEYYRKVKSYNYLTVDYTYVPIQLTANSYEKDIYYYLPSEKAVELESKIEELNKNAELTDYQKEQELQKLYQEYYLKDEDKAFDLTKSYYYKAPKNKSKQYTKIELEEFDPENNPVYFREKNNYLLEDSEIARSVNYFKLNPKDGKYFKYAYERDVFYFKEGNTYHRSENEIHTPGLPYYKLEWGKNIIKLLNPIQDLKQYDSVNGLYGETEALYFWAPDIFWTYDETSKQYTKADKYDANTQYYLCSFTVKEVDTDPKDPNNKLLEAWTIIDAYKVKVIEDYQNYFYLNDQNGFSPITKTLYDNFIKNNYYGGDPNGNYDSEKMPLGYLKDARFLPDFSINIEEDIYYSISSPEQINDFYYPNKYYYDKDSNYIIDTEFEVTEDRVYYLEEDLNISLFGENFYKPNTFFYDIDNHTPENGVDFIPVIDASLRKTPGRNYYIKNDLYVKSDEKGLYSVGSVWPYTIDIIPHTIEIANREESYELRSLIGFARTLNTIHGLILQINNLLLLNDEYTRDRKTVQGTINTLNDIINKFADLKAGKLLITDNYGIVRTAAIDTNDWLEFDVNGNVDNPYIYLNHLYLRTDIDSSDKTNMNEPVQNKINDKINIEYTTIDGAGHVIKKHTEEYTLPYGFKELIVAENNTEETSLTHTKGNIIADNTQDSLQIGAANKWIKLAANADNDILLFGHEIHDIDISAKDDTDFNAGTGGPNGTPLDSIIIQDVQFDAAGHVTHNQNHKYKLPNSYGVFATDENGVTAKSVCDTFNFAGDKWINTTIDNDLATLKITHAAPSNVAKSAGQDKTNVVLGFNDNFKSVYVETDANGHVVTLEEKILTLPNLDESKVTLLNLKYDFNDDGVVDEKDQEMLANHIAEKGEIITDKELLARMDINGDGVVDAADMTILAWLIANSDITVSEAITNLSISSRDMKSDISSMNNKITNINNNITSINNNITDLGNNINNIETLLGITEGTTALTVEEQIAAALEAFKTDVLKDYALKTYVDDEIEKATQVDTNTTI